MIMEDIKFNLYLVPHHKMEKLIKNNKDGGNNQKLKLLSLGKAISGAPIKIGTKKLPKPPNEIGTITKKSIKIPCNVTTIL